MKNKRIGYYDIARGVGILFVVIGHIESIYAPLREYVTYFHMALFFCISGMLMFETGEENKSFLQTVKKRFGRIMVPYFLFSLIVMGIELVRLIAKDISPWENFRGQIILTVVFLGISVLWFLPALFLSELLFLAVRRLTAGKTSARKAEEGKTTAGKWAHDLRTIVLLVLIVGLMIFLNENRTSSTLLFVLVRVGFCTGFIGIGYFGRKYIIPSKPLPVIEAVTGGLLLIICLVISRLNGNVDLRAMSLGSAPVYICGAAAGAFGIIFLCKAMQGFEENILMRGLCYLGCNSLIIMATHLDCHIVHYSTDVAGFLNRFVNNEVFLQAAILILVMAAEVVIVELCNRFFPILNGKHKK